MIGEQKDIPVCTKGNRLNPREDKPGRKQTTFVSEKRW
jgi:hypothetical protein